MANSGMAILLLVLFAIAGLGITFNIGPDFLYGGGIGFNDINGFTSGFWILFLRLLIGPALIIVPLYMAYSIIRN